MVRKTGSVLAALMLMAAVQIGGCASLLPSIPIPLNFADAGISEFEVQAGVPNTAKADFSGDPLQIQASSGTISVDLSAIRVEPANDGGSKSRLTHQQVIDNCNVACIAAGIDTATCADVCDENELLVTVWIGTTSEIDADCDNGDRYDVNVQLDDNGVPVSIEIEPSQLTQNTVSLLNSGVFSVCVRVISPVDGTVFVDEMVVNVSL